MGTPPSPTPTPPGANREFRSSPSAPWLRIRLRMARLRHQTIAWLPAHPAPPCPQGPGGTGLGCPPPSKPGQSFWSGNGFRLPVRWTVRTWLRKPRRSCSLEHRQLRMPNAGDVQRRLVLETRRSPTVRDQPGGEPRAGKERGRRKGRRRPESLMPGPGEREGEGVQAEGDQAGRDTLGGAS